jgi:hypothetical protein
LHVSTGERFLDAIIDSVLVFRWAGVLNAMVEETVVDLIL